MGAAYSRLKTTARGWCWAVLPPEEEWDKLEEDPPPHMPAVPFTAGTCKLGWAASSPSGLMAGYCIL